MTQENKEQADTVAEQLSVIKDDLARLATLVKDAARAQAYEARTVAAETYDQTKETVRRNPTAAMGIALGAGVVLARTVLRRRF